MRVLFFILLIILSGCSVTQRNKSFDITGKWNFESHEFIGSINSFPLPGNSNGEGSFFSFFGAQVWSNCNGKNIEFLNDGKLKTDLTNQESLDALNFQYNLQLEDSIIVFSNTLPNSNLVNKMPVHVSFQDGKMIWKIDDVLKIALKRIT